MEDIIKKGLLTAIGTASIAAEKADKILKDVAKRGLVTSKEARSIVKKLVKEAEKGQKRLQEIISAEIEKSLKKAKPILKEGKIAAKKAVSTAKKLQKTAEKRGQSIVRKATKRPR